MAADAFADWFARARAHQQAGRFADAVPCFRRAARELPGSPLPHFHLGEAWWALGLAPAAVSAWQVAAALDKAFLPPRLALAEVALVQGDFLAAHEGAAAAAELAPSDARAVATAVLVDAAIGDDAALQRLPDLLVADPTLVGSIALGNALATVLRLPARGEWRARLMETLGHHVEDMTPVLLTAFADADGTVPPAVAHRFWSPGDATSLRRLAMAIFTRDQVLAADLASSYNALCSLLPSPAVPLLWPRRTAGASVRVAWVCPHLGAGEGTEFLRALGRGLSSNSHGFAHVVLAAGDARATYAALAGTALDAAPVIELPADPDSDTARLIAAHDCDVLIDAAGLSAATGPILAARPARRIWSLPAGAPAHGTALVDRYLDAPDSLGDALFELRQEVAGEATAALSAEALADTWNGAVAKHRSGDVAAAASGYAEVLGAQPGFAPALHLCAVLAVAEGDAVRANESFDRAMAAAPHFVEARLAGIEFALKQHDVERAIRLAREGVTRAPRDVALLRVLGLAELVRRDGMAAEAAFLRVLRIVPADADAHFNHGVALQMRGDTQEAARAYQRALVFDPTLVAADFNLGVLFAQQGNSTAAIAAYTTVLAAESGHVTAYKNLGEALFAAGRIDAWRENFRRFEAHCPDALPLAVQALEVCQYDGDFVALERYLERLRQEKFVARDELELVDALEELLYLLLFFDVEPGMVHRFAQTYDAAASRLHGPAMPRSAQRRPGPLRVGYLSADLRNHVMGKMMWQAIEQHDRLDFDWYFYSTSTVRDDWTGRFEGIARGFEAVAAVDDAVAATRIAEDDLDLLVDLSTHTRGARPGILARKPARVQLTHVASAGTVGLSAIDFKLTDHFADVGENQAYQIERLLAMDGCVYPFRSVAPAARHPFHRGALGIDAKAIVIGAFVNPLKLSRRCLSLWRDVLTRIPRAVLAFSPANPTHREAYVRLATAVGIAPERLAFLPQGRDDAENQSRYDVVDFVLDTMPFGGVNGTIEALAMGVPVVTLVGKRHGERTSYSILVNLEVTQTIAATGRDYVRIAVRLADDPPFRAEVKAAIAAGLVASPLTDRLMHTRNLEAAYRVAIGAHLPALPSEM